MVCSTSASGLCNAILNGGGDGVHIDVLRLPAAWSESEVASYLYYLTGEWAAMWDIALTIGTTGVDGSSPVFEAEVNALDALLSTYAEKGVHVPSADAVSAFAYPCATAGGLPSKIADGFCIDPLCRGCAGAGVALMDFIKPPSYWTKQLAWYMPVSQSAIPRWRR